MTDTATPGAVAVGKQKHKLPDGIATPIEALNHLKTHKNPTTGELHAPADFQPQRMYGLLKPTKNADPFPVKHYDAEGKAFDEAQVHPVTGVTTTRPGVKIDEVVDWWGRAGERQAAKNAAKAAKAAAAKAKADAKAAQAGTAESAPAGDVEAAEESGETFEDSPEDVFEDVEEAQ
jgi:hypothetical protein